MQTWEIWTEGYAATGDSQPATLHGSIDAPTFKEACQLMAQRDKEFARYFDADSMTYWACRLFSNEQEARKSFG